MKTRRKAKDKFFQISMKVVISMYIVNFTPMIVATIELFLFIILGATLLLIMLFMIEKYFKQKSNIQKIMLKGIIVFFFSITIMIIADDIISFLMRNMARGDTTYRFEDYKELIRAIRPGFFKVG